MRAGLYARFSTDLQNPGSIGDQLAAGRLYAEKIGAQVVDQFQDAAISGAAMANRPGLAAMLAAARAGAIDIVIAEDLSRLTRDGGHAWDIFGELERLGVAIHTIAEGRIEELAIILKGGMNALERKAIGARVRRGLTGVIKSGRLAGKPPYGYQTRREYDAGGEPIRGLVEIDPAQAAIVRRVHAEFLAGASGHAIANRLNAEGVASPAGALWHSNAIIGDARRLQGLLRNPIYAGEVVWNRATHPKDRRTGKAATRINGAADMVRQAAPDLRIIDPDTWAGVQARLVAQRAAVKAANNASAANMPRRLFSGLLKCGLCNAALITAGPGRRYRCRARTDKGPIACANSRTAPSEALEAEILAMLHRDLLHPEVVETVVREYRELQAATSSAAQARRAALERDLAEARRRADRLLDQVADGVLTGRAVQGKLKELEARQAAAQDELDRLEAGADVVALHPHAATRYRALVADLQAKLAGDDIAQREAARTALRQVIRAVHMFPGEARGQWRLEIDGDLTSLFQQAAQTAKRQRRAKGD